MAVTNSFYDSYHQANNNDYYRGRILFDDFTYRNVLQTIKAALAISSVKPKVLDMGCGVGSLSQFVAPKASLVVGIDVSKQAIEIARRARTGNTISNTIFVVGKTAPINAYFDLVICSEVIEHVPNVDEFLAMLYASLKPGGYLVITTPSSENMLTKIGYFRSFDAKVGHLRRFTEQTLKQLITQHGFKITFFRKTDGLMRILFFTTPLLKLVRFIKGPIKAVVNVFDAASIMFFGAHDFQIVVRKPR